MPQQGSQSTRPALLPGPLDLAVYLIPDLLGRFGRHWFMLGVLFGGLCLAIRGTILYSFGVAFLFREDQPLTGSFVDNALHSQAFFTGLMSMLMTGAVWVFAVDLDASSAQHLDRYRLPGQMLLLSSRVLVLGLLPLYCLTHPASRAVQTMGPAEWHRALAGWGLGYGLDLSILALAFLVEYGLKAFNVTHLGIARRLRLHLPHLHSSVEWKNVAWRVMTLFAMFVGAWLLIMLKGLQFPVVAIFALVGVLLAGYVFLNFFVESVRFWALGALVAVTVLIHGNPTYSYTFPGLEQLYLDCDSFLAKHPRAADADPRQAIVCAEKAAGSSATSDFRPVGRARALSQLGSLHMPSRIGGGVRLPRLVVVSISGGAYRAAFWGALVLDKLREESEAGRSLEGLAQSVRLLTGASGGMVPAAYFAMLPPGSVAAPGPEEGPQSLRLRSLIAADIARANGLPEGSQSYDSLSQIARQLVGNDLLNIVLPWRSGTDRGRELDKQWRTLDVTFGELRADEEAGRRPSLIFSPMIAETGQPLLISNLKLDGIAESGQTFDLFGRLPEAARSLTLATAVRMSATFPLVSPAVSLPTIPALHVLDAGYFDNYGMGIALSYLKQPDVLEWLADNTSGVLMIQIDAYPVRTFEDAVSDPECKERSTGSVSHWFERLMSPVSSPLDGLFASRGASMVFHNDQEFDTLRQLVTKRTGKDGLPLRFDRVSFENSAHASFSWYLPAGDLDCMRKQLNDKYNLQAFQNLKQLWNDWSPSVSASDTVIPGTTP